MLEVLLRLDDPALVKSALQRICTVKESGRELRDASVVGDVLTRLLWSPEIGIRRWTYKAIALLDDPVRHFQPLMSRVLSGDSDPENKTWSLAAIFAIATQENLAEVQERRLFPNEGAALLAAHLYNRRLPGLIVPAAIDVERADILTLQWSSLLVGYGRAPENLFHPRIDNRALMAQLNKHPDPIVSEYSVWGLHQNKNYGVGDLGFPEHQIGKQPENVRRWTNRLITKDGPGIAHRLDLLDERSKDVSAKAREGLAIGIRPLWTDGLDVIVLQWHSREQNATIRELLVEHIAAFSDKSDDYRDLARQIYDRSTTSSLLRDRILAASVGTEMYLDIRQELSSNRVSTPLLLELPREINVTQNFNTQGGPLSIGANSGSGDIAIAATALVQQMTGQSLEQQKALTDVIDLANRLPSPQAKALEQQVAEYAQTKDKSALTKIADTLASVKDSTEHGRDIALAAAALWTVTKSLFGL